MPIHQSLLSMQHDPSEAAQDADMTRSLTGRAPRRTAYGALVLFGLAYLGVLAIIFAPEGSLSSRSSLTAMEQGE